MSSVSSSINPKITALFLHSAFKSTESLLQSTAGIAAGTETFYQG